MLVFSMSWHVQREYVNFNLQSEIEVLKSDKEDLIKVFNVAAKALSDRKIGTPIVMTKTIPDNNPGHLVKGERWKGEVKCDGRFECFKTPLYGIRAMAKVLNTYKTRYNLTTIEDVIHRWAPPNENHTKNYIYFVKKTVDSTDDIVGMIKAMIVFENGHNPYSDDLIREAVRMI